MRFSYPLSLGVKYTVNPTTSHNMKPVLISVSFIVIIVNENGNPQTAHSSLITQNWLFDVDINQRICYISSLEVHEC